jgi:hypothetical protein
MAVTIAEHGASDEAAENCLDALLDLYPDSGPVVSQNTSTGNLTLTVSVEATDPWAAANLGSSILTKSLNRAHLRVTPVLDVNVTIVEHDDSTENIRELIEA